MKITILNKNISHLTLRYNEVYNGLRAYFCGIKNRNVKIRRTANCSPPDFLFTPSLINYNHESKPNLFRLQARLFSLFSE